MRRSISKRAGGAAALATMASLGLALTPSAHAEDFFSALFGGFRMRPPPEIRVPFPSDDVPRTDAPRQRAEPFAAFVGWTQPRRWRSRLRLPFERRNWNNGAQRRRSRRVLAERSGAERGTHPRKETKWASRWS